MLAAFYLSNTKKELNYYGTGKTTAELQKIIQDAEVFDDDNYEFLQETESFEDEQFNYEEEEGLEIENLVNLDAEEIMSGLDKIMKEDVESDYDIHSISSNSDTVNEKDWDPRTIADKYADD
jgi:hypothetical protein